MHFYGNNSSKTNYFVEKFVIVEPSTITKYRFKNGKSDGMNKIPPEK